MVGGSKFGIEVFFLLWHLIKISKGPENWMNDAATLRNEIVSEFQMLELLSQIAAGKQVHEYGVKS